MAPPNLPGPELPPGRDNQNPQPPGRFSKGLLGWVIFFGLGLLLVTILSSRFDDRREISIVQFWSYVENRLVTRPSPSTSGLPWRRATGRRSPSLK